VAVHLHTVVSSILALDGESALQGNTGLAVIALASMVAGYVLIGVLWYFVFRGRGRGGRRRDSSD
jgi:hypothetical protein